MLKRPATLAELLVALVACGILLVFMGSGTQDGDSTTAGDLQKQLSQQFSEQWGTGGFESVEISHFERPSLENDLVIGLRIRWDKQTGTGTAMSLYRAADRYYVGTFVPQLPIAGLPAPLQERVKTLHPVRILLSFKS
jgi:hypothetical protein